MKFSPKEGRHVLFLKNLKLVTTSFSSFCCLFGGETSVDGKKILRSPVEVDSLSDYLRQVLSMVVSGSPKRW